MQIKAGGVTMAAAVVTHARRWRTGSCCSRRQRVSPVRP